jgi:hypothetical protein
LPIGSFQGRDGRKRKVGSLLSTSAAAVGRTSSDQPWRISPGGRSSIRKPGH